MPLVPRKALGDGSGAQKMPPFGRGQCYFFGGGGGPTPGRKIRGQCPYQRLLFSHLALHQIGGWGQDFGTKSPKIRR